MEPLLGSSGKQEKLLQALTRGLADVAQIDPWTTSLDPGTSTLERLLELTQDLAFAAFVFPRNDWTSAAPSIESAQASPRANVVFGAGLFDGVLGMRRTFILHSTWGKLPTDLLGLTCVRYGEAATAADVRLVNFGPVLEGAGEILLESVDRAAGYFTRLDGDPTFSVRTAGAAEALEVALADATPANGESRPFRPPGDPVAARTGHRRPVG